MDFSQVKQSGLLYWKRYRPVLLVLFIGLGLLLLPAERESEPAPSGQVSSQDEKPDLQEELSCILSGLQGAGRVQVLLTRKLGEEILYQSDENSNSSDTSQAKSRQTVTVTDDKRNQTGLIRQVNPPVYLGAVVLCQGADSSAVRLAIVEAVSNATGLPTHKISVLKMK